MLFRDSTVQFSFSKDILDSPLISILSFDMDGPVSSTQGSIFRYGLLDCQYQKHISPGLLLCSSTEGCILLLDTSFN